MSLEPRILMVALAVYAAVSLIATGIVLALAFRPPVGPAAVRARRIADLRLFPAATAAVIGVIVFAAFVAFEPAWASEDMGTATPMLAAFATVLVAGSLWRGFQLVRVTRQATRAWLEAGEAISLPQISVPAFAVVSDFPVVTVIGFLRPRLVIARSVLDSCTAEELGAILAHEQGHIDRRDNLRRLLMGMAPDVITWLPIAARWFADWREAAEDAADDDAVKAGADGKLRLAQALVKVARLAPGSRPHAAIPASALYRGESLDRRVRRLISSREAAPSQVSHSGAASLTWLLRVTVVVLVAGSFTMLENIHGLVEGLIHSLP